MRKADIIKLQKAGELVAVAQYLGGVQDKGIGYASCEAAEVLATGQERKVYSGERWDWSGHFASDGVRVKFINTDEEKIVGPRQVLASWDEYNTARRALLQREQLQAKKNQSQEAETMRVAKQLEDIVGQYLKKVDGGIVLSIDDAKMICSLIEG